MEGSENNKQSVPNQNDPSSSSSQSTAGQTPSQSSFMNSQPAQSEGSSQPVQSENSGQSKPSYVVDVGDNRGQSGRFADKNQSEQKGNSIVTTIVIIIIVVLGIWYFTKDSSNNEVDNGNNQNESGMNVNDSQANDGTTIVDGDDQSTESEKIKITAYFSKNVGNDCSVVEPLEREVEKKYQSDVVDTVIGLLTPLTEEEKQAGYSSSIPPGTLLTNVNVNNGTAIINFNAALNKIAGSCAVTAARAQIEQTLLQFPYINSVIICAGGNCNEDEIMQP